MAEKEVSPNMAGMDSDETRKIESWLDEETLQMMTEYSSAQSETERKQLCLKWRLASRLHPSYMFEPS